MYDNLILSYYLYLQNHMIIYNVTTKVDYSIHSDWLTWMKEKHIPDVMRTGMFLSSRLCRLIDPIDNDGFTYAVQYFAKDINKIKSYKNNYAPALIKEHKDLFRDKALSFRTLLKVVE